MPVTGRKPKPDGLKRNRVAPTHDWTEVVDVPFEGAPAMPGKRPDGRPWPAATRRWWQVIGAMPHCVLWSPADWEFALTTALVVAAVHEGELKLATELRNRERVLGTTADFRRDLRIRYVDAPAAQDEEAMPGVANLNDYRASLDD